jgi:hypothetical protein
MPDKALANHIRTLGDVPAQPDTYRGWSIYRGRWPEPAWMAYGPNYDAWTEGEGDWADNGEKTDATTWEGICAEIDIWFEENSDA